MPWTASKDLYISSYTRKYIFKIWCSAQTLVWEEREEESLNIFVLLSLPLWANSLLAHFCRLLLFILLFLFPRIHLQSQFELQCMAITKEIKYYYPHLQAFWPHSSWLFYFQYLKCSTPSVPLKKYLLHFCMHYSIEEEKKYHLSIYESFLSLLFTFTSLCVSFSYDLLNYFWPNTMS